MMDDKALRRAVIEALDREPGVPATWIGVAVENGIVMLTGHVTTSAEKLTAEQAVRRVDGVVAVEPNIAVRALGRTGYDEEIARRARVVIAWHVGVQDGAITAQVENGWVTLTGTVEDTYERREAEAAVRTLDDVAGVTNLLQTKASASTVPTAPGGPLGSVSTQGLPEQQLLNRRHQASRLSVQLPGWT
jgi:osmotically-inducible protein OsmY